MGSVSATSGPDTELQVPDEILQKIGIKTSFSKDVPKLHIILTDRASTIPSNIRGCQSGTWSQTGIKVNGSHHGDNPLLRPAGIQIATKSYATLQAIAPTNNKTVHQTSFALYREQPRSTLNSFGVFFVLFCQETFFLFPMYEAKVLVIFSECHCKAEEHIKKILTLKRNLGRRGPERSVT